MIYKVGENMKKVNALSKGGKSKKRVKRVKSRRIKSYKSRRS
jgi:hypothetical protein